MPHLLKTHSNITLPSTHRPCKRSLPFWFSDHNFVYFFCIITCPTHLILLCTSPCHVQSVSLHHLDNEDSSWFPPSVRTVHDTCPVRSAKHMGCQQELVGCPILCALSCYLEWGLSAADQHSQVQEEASSLWLQTQQHKCYWKINRLGNVHTQ